MSYNPYKKRGRGPPPGLTGKDIGLYYRNKSMAKKKEKEKNEVWKTLNVVCNELSVEFQAM